MGLLKHKAYRPYGRAYYQYILFHDKSYDIICAEQQFIIHPSAFNLMPASEKALDRRFTLSFSLKGYKLYLNEINIADCKEQPECKDLIACTAETMASASLIKDKQVLYNGAILIGLNPVKQYHFLNEDQPCFSYKYVYELVFNKGILETTVDHSRAMLRIRKNLELGLRSLDKSRDIRCIRRFINNALIGDYRPFASDGKLLDYLADMKTLYNVQE